MPIAKNRDCSIHYEAHGEGGSPVLFSAGMGGSAHFWKPQIDEFSSRHRVVLYDQVGSGRSDRQLSGKQSVDRMATDILAILDDLRIERVHLIGHAIGGIVGMKVAQLAPNRLSSLVVVNGWLKADEHIKRCFGVRKDILRKSGVSAYLFAQPLFLFPPQWIAQNHELLNEEADRAAKTFPCIDVLLEKIDMFLGFDGAAIAKEISTPTLLTTTKDDFLVPSYLTKRLQASIKNSVLKEYESGAHAFCSVNPEVFNRDVMQFLSAIDSQHF